MIVQPLFGRDSCPHKTSLYLSLMITAGLWLILLICALFIKIPEKRKFKEMQITLGSAEFEQNVVEEIVPEEIPVPSEPEQILQPEAIETVTETISQPEIETPVVVPAEVVSPAQPAAEPKPAAPAKSQATPVTNPEPAKTQPISENKSPAAPLYEIQQSVEDAITNQFSTKKSVSDADWDSMFNSDVSSNMSNSGSSAKVMGESTVSGSAGNVEKSKPVSAAEESVPAQKVSSETSKMINDIVNAKVYSSRKSTNNSSYAEISTSKSTDGTVFFEMDNGKRSLIEPLTAAIPISDKAGQTIDSNREVTISFFVDKNGNVPRSEINITPRSTLTNEIIEEILATMSHWRFDSSDSSSRASFKFKIEKK